MKIDFDALLTSIALGSAAIVAVRQFDGFTTVFGFCIAGGFFVFGYLFMLRIKQTRNERMKQ